MQNQYENVTTIQYGSDSPEPSLRSPSIQNNVGGVTTYNVPCETNDLPAQSSRPSVQANVGSVITVGANGTQIDPGFQQYDTSQMTSGQSGFMGTARNGFFPAMGDLNAETVVNYGGMEIQLGTLEGMGVVRRTATGYEEITSQGTGSAAPQGNQNAPQQATSAALPDGVELFSASVEATVAEAIQPFPQALYEATVAQALAKGINNVNFNDIAYHSGMTPAEARLRAGVAMKAFQDQSDGIVKSSGINNPQEFYAWAKTERKDELENATRELAFGRYTKSLRALTSDYFASEAPSIEALKGAGLPVRTSHTGESVVLIKGAWMTPAAAAKAGLI